MNAPAAHDQPWYTQAFNRDYLDRYAHRDDGAARAHAPFLLRALAVKPGAKVLDWCCGAGRYSRALQVAGLDVTGVDLSADLLAHAREQKTAVRYLQADMRELPLPDASFDGVVNLFTSFGYFEDDTENRRALDEAVRVLKPGGMFVQDFLNLTHTLTHLKPRTERIAQGDTAQADDPVESSALKERICETRRYDEARKRLEKRVTITDAASGAVLRELTESVRAYAPVELDALFAAAGLEVIARYGDLDGVAFEEKFSPRCVTVARKRADA